MLIIYIYCMPPDDPDESPESRHTINPIKSMHSAVKEEYLGAFRTNSYTDICTQVQEHHKYTTNNSKRKPRNQDYTHLLEPKQEVLSSIIRCATHLPSLLLDYFDASLHACNFCGSLIESIHQARADHRILRGVLDLATAGHQYYTEDQHHSMASNLVLFSKLDNPFSGPSSPTKFQRIHEAHGLMARQLAVSAHGKVGRRPRFLNLARGVIAMVENFVVGAAGEEGISEAREGAQLDAAARGAFALDRDFDTMSRMVRRLHDEVEHGRDVIRSFMVDGDMKGGWMMLREVVRELQVSEGCFVDQLAELEDHVYLCFLNINRARRMVLEEMVVHKQDWIW